MRVTLYFRLRAGMMPAIRTREVVLFGYRLPKYLGFQPSGTKISEGIRSTTLEEPHLAVELSASVVGVCEMNDVEFDGT
ncbi:hypothetical protein JMJ77_0006659 [Colletotrichum scovillei]|uniref:Uncharacterized protein n=1 Tax=Colletotrichum scovillei TaxID=1209932 RepID=A0A9P7RKS9_9PEZI|nr:hypothetical protein JMJ77_0006659 [Colletotrichum scovillei]KAG7077862.1 hypothetical protein JMJ76_0015104 [Colletotrichum scovillei]KAG7084999.1 hypothetical protein JMJ78_0010429 [Colletotrichum scovillei]